MKHTTMDQMVDYIKEHGLERLVAELNFDGGNFHGAVQWVYDGHTMSREEFRKKYFGF